MDAEVIVMRPPIRYLSRIVPRLQLLPSADDAESPRADNRAPGVGGLRRRMIRIGPGLLFDTWTGSMLAL